MPTHDRADDREASCERCERLGKELHDVRQEVDDIAQEVEQHEERLHREMRENESLNKQLEQLGERYDALSYEARELVQTLRKLLDYERYEETNEVHALYRSIEDVEDALREGERVRPQVY